MTDPEDRLREFARRVLTRDLATKLDTYWVRDEAIRLGIYQVDGQVRVARDIPKERPWQR